MRIALSTVCVLIERYARIAVHMMYQVMMILTLARSSGVIDEDPAYDDDDDEDTAGTV